MQSCSDVSRLMMYFLRFVISGHDGFRHLLCYLLKTPVLHSWGSLSCPGNRSCWICGRFPNELIPKPTKSARISDMDGYFLDVTTRRLVVYGGKEGVLVSWNVLHVLSSSERERYTAMKSIARTYYTRTISSICCCTEQFPWFPAFRQMGCNFMWVKWLRLPIQRKRLTSTIRCQQTVSLRASNG